VVQGRGRLCGLGGAYVPSTRLVLIYQKGNNVPLFSPMVLAPELYRIKDVVCDFYGVDRDKLHTSKRGSSMNPDQLRFI
jgi:hypothetical protein